MIQISAASLPAEAERGLKRYQRQVNREPIFAKRVKLASAKFKQHNTSRNKVFRAVRSTLDSMCAGARRCMYCEDSAADEVEHHHPKNLYPELVFVWSNYLYACGPCNGLKNNRFAIVTRKGKIIEVAAKKPTRAIAAMIHPRIENPLDLIMLDIQGDTFLFVPFYEEDSVERRRAEYTIEALGLNNRDLLRRERRVAYEAYLSLLERYVHRREEHASGAETKRIVDAIQKMPHPTVWREMQRQRTLIPELAQLFQRAPEALSWSS